MPPKRRTLIVGGHGFIGERLQKELKALKVSVTAPKKAELDVTKDAKKLRALLDEHEVLVILTQPSEEGITTIASALALSHPVDVLYTSTSLIYKSNSSPQTEEASLEPITPYERLKLMEEERLVSINSKGLVRARLGNVYGGMKNKGIIAKAFAAAISGEPLTISGENQKRDFVHVDDVARVLAQLVLLKGKKQVVNVGTGKGTSIQQALELLEETIGKKIPKKKNETATPLKHTICDTRKLFNLVGFIPEITLEEGIKKTYAKSIHQ